MADTIKITFKDGTDYDLPKKDIEQITFIKGIYEEDDSCETIPLNHFEHVSRDRFLKIIEFLKMNEKNKYINIPRPIVTPYLHLVTAPCYNKWIKDMSQKQLFETLQTAIYLQVGQMIDLCAAAVATDIMSCDKIEDIRTYTCQENDYTEEELKEIEEDNETLYDFLQRDEEDEDN